MTGSYYCCKPYWFHQLPVQLPFYVAGDRAHCCPAETACFNCFCFCKFDTACIKKIGISICAAGGASAFPAIIRLFLQHKDIQDTQLPGSQSSRSTNPSLTCILLLMTCNKQWGFLCSRLKYKPVPKYSPFILI